MNRQVAFSQHDPQHPRNPMTIITDPTTTMMMAAAFSRASSEIATFRRETELVSTRNQIPMPRSVAPASCSNQRTFKSNPNSAIIVTVVTTMEFWGYVFTRMELWLKATRTELLVWSWKRKVEKSNDIGIQVWSRQRNKSDTWWDVVAH